MPTGRPLSVLNERSWSERNKLVHSHFVHRQVTVSGNSYLSAAGRKLWRHPNEGGPVIISTIDSAGNKRTLQSDIVEQGFGYFVFGDDGTREFVPVNKGTFVNHAAVVGSWSTFVATMNRAIGIARAPLRPLPMRSISNRGKRRDIPESGPR